MSENFFSCEFCHYKSNRAYNLKRHIVIKHTENDRSILDNSKSIINNSVSKKDNSTSILNNSSSIIDNLKNKQCDKCEKVFSKRCTMVKHKEKCKGKVNPLECNFCKQLFTLPPAKYRHQKTCKEKDKPIDSQSLVQNIETQNNIQTQNNITNNNITNNNTINIISFDPDEECNFVKTEAFNKQIKRLLMQYTNEIKLIKSYNRNLFLIKDNQCVKKTNLRSLHSKVHMGDNKWEIMLDKNVYPKLVSDYANDFCNLILSQNRERHRSLERKLDCIADGGYINDEEEVQKKLTKDYNDLVHDLKILAYENK